MPSYTGILGVSGSPREGGNTDILVRETLRLLGEATGAETDFIRVSDFNILPCRGCRECMKLGCCVIQGDDFEAVMERFFAADLFILGAPVYWLGPPGVMKNLIDRSHAYWIVPAVFRGKEAALISVAADSGFEPHEAVMKSWLEVYGARMVGSARIFSREMGEVLDRPEELGKVARLAEGVVNRKMLPGKDCGNDLSPGE